MKRKIISVLCLLSVVTGGVSAAPIDSLEEDVTTGKIKVSGDFSGQCRYSVLLAKPEVDADSLNSVTDEELAESLVTLLHQNTADGKYSIEIPMKADNPSGTYTISVHGENDSEPTRMTILWYNPVEIAELFSYFKNSSTSDDVLSIIKDEENCNKLGVSYELIKNLSTSELSSVASVLFNKKNDIADIDAFGDEFDKTTILKAIAAAKTNAEAKTLIVSYSDVLGISNNDSFISFTGKSETYQNITAGKLTESEFDSFDKFAKLFEDASILADIECAASAADANKILVENKAKFSSKIDKYFSSSNTSAYDKQIVGKSYSSLGDLEDAIVKLVNSGGGTGGKGNGSSSSGSAVPSIGAGSNAVISTPSVALPQNNFFDDLDSVEWAKNAIESLAQEGVLSGKGDNKFYPQDYVKREEFVKMLVGSFNVTAEGTIPFSDVYYGTWYYDYVVSAYNSGKVKGISAEQFGTGTNITRQDMAVLVYRYLADITTLPDSGTVEFTDKVDISEYARDAIAALREAGIVSGMTDGSFKPKDNCTRAQVAYIIYKALKYAGKM